MHAAFISVTNPPDQSFVVFALAEATMRERHLRPIKERTRLSELEAWDDLFGYCIQCGKIGQIEKSALSKRYGADVILEDISCRLVCRACGTRRGNEFGTSNRPRD